MEERNTTELSGEELIHAVVTGVEQLQSEQFDHTTASFDSLLPSYGRCNIVQVEDKSAESGPEIAKFHLGTGLDDTVSSDCDIRLQQNKLKSLDSFTSNFVGQNYEEISPNRNDGFGIQENSTEPSAELVAIKTQLQQQQKNNSNLKSQVKQHNEVKLEFQEQLNILTDSHPLNVKTFLDDRQQLQSAHVEQEPTAEVRSPLSYYGQVEQRRGIETMRSHTEECSKRIVTVARSKDDVTLHHEPVGSSAEPMSLFQDDNIHQSDGSLHMKQSTDASPKNPQSSRSGSETHSCAECKKQFAYKSHLIEHVRIHTDDRSFICYICKKSFRQKTHLSRHMDIHSGRKAHKCSVCEKEFRQKSNLTRHFEIHLKKKPSQL